jgi:hypothetical protein
LTYVGGYPRVVAADVSPRTLGGETFGLDRVVAVDWIRTMNHDRQQEGSARRRPSQQRKISTTFGCNDALQILKERFPEDYLDIHTFILHFIGAPASLGQLSTKCPIKCAMKSHTKAKESQPKE